MRRGRAAAFRRLAAALGARLAELAGEDGWVLIGGTPAWARLAGEALPASLVDRALVSAALDHDHTDADISRAAKEAASALLASRGRTMLDQLLEPAAASGRAAVGVPATQRALRAHAVDVLLLSPEAVRSRALLAEEGVRAALGQGSDVEVLSGDAATRLDRVADGMAARLRSAVDAPASSLAASGREEHGVGGAGAQRVAAIDSGRYEEYP